MDLREILERAAAGIPLEVEIGCGNGHFLAEYCEKNRERFFFGIELKAKRCLKARRKLEQRALANAAVLQGRAEEILKQLPEGCLDRVHIYFPDPWPKTKHRKRRFTTLANLELLHRALKPGGTILFATDFYDYYLQTKTLFILHRGLELSEDRPPAEIFNSIYGQKLQDQGRRIYLAAARKKVSGSDNATGTG